MTAVHTGWAHEISIRDFMAEILIVISNNLLPKLKSLLN